MEKMKHRLGNRRKVENKEGQLLFSECTNDQRG